MDEYKDDKFPQQTPPPKKRTEGKNASPQGNMQLWSATKGHRPAHKVEP